MNDKMTKLLIDNKTHRLYMERGGDYNYIAFVKAAGFIQEVGRAWRLTKGVTRFFSKSEIESAKSRRHA